MQSEKIISIKKLGDLKTIDIEVDNKSHLYFGNGIAISNSHSDSYSAISAVEFWLKHNFLTEYVAALMNNSDEAATYVNYARKNSITVLPPSINHSKANFSVEDGKIRYSINHIHQVGDTAVEHLIKNQPYSSLEDWILKMPRRQANKKIFMNLLYAGAFDEFGNRYDLLLKFFKHRLVEEERKREEKRKKPKKEGAKKTKKQENDEETVEQILEEHYYSKIWVAKEYEVLGTCLSKEPILLQYKDYIKDNKLCPISEVHNRGKTFVFGRIESVVGKTSKAGKQMQVCTISDDLDTMKFYIWSNGFMKFSKQARIGYICAIPINKFDSDENEKSDLRFFDTNKEITVIKK